MYSMTVSGDDKISFKFVFNDAIIEEVIILVMGPSSLNFSESSISIVTTNLFSILEDLRVRV